ncbi:MAG: hypothetical protein ABIG85_00420, partial [Chloroflexota bacterium]
MKPIPDEELIRTYGLLLIEHADLSQAGDFRRANWVASRIAGLERVLATRGSEAMAGFLRLTEHEHPAVRAWVASVATIFIDPATAVPLLESIASERHGVASVTAWAVLL